MVTKVDKGDAVGKLVDNYKWVLAAEIPFNQSELINIGDEIYMRFSDSDEEPVKGVVENMSEEDSGKVIIRIRSNKYSKTVYRTYKSQVQLIKHTYSGIKVPQEALRIVDGKKGVYVLSGMKINFVPVDILYSNESYIICDKKNENNNVLKLYDSVVVKGKNLYDGKIIS